jgi:hypothetical protein
MPVAGMSGGFFRRACDFLTKPAFSLPFELIRFKP